MAWKLQDMYGLSGLVLKAEHRLTYGDHRPSHNISVPSDKFGSVLQRTEATTSFSDIVPFPRITPTQYFRHCNSFSKPCMPEAPTYRVAQQFMKHEEPWMVAIWGPRYRRRAQLLGSDCEAGCNDES